MGFHPESLDSGLLLCCHPHLPLPLLQVKNHQANPSSTPGLEPPLLVVKSRLPCHSPHTDFTMEQKTSPRWQQTAELHNAPSETKRSEKNMVARDRIPPDPAISMLQLHIGVHKRSLPEPDTPARSRGTCVRQIFVLAREET